LVYLDKRVIPTEIQQAFTTSFEAPDTKTELAAKVYDMNTLLAGTHFISGGKTFEADIFSNFKI